MAYYHESRPHQAKDNDLLVLAGGVEKAEEPGRASVGHSLQEAAGRAAQALLPQGGVPDIPLRRASRRHSCGCRAT